MAHHTASTPVHFPIVQLGQKRRELGSISVERSSSVDARCQTQECDMLDSLTCLDSTTFPAHHTHIQRLTAMASSLPSVLVLGGILEGTAAAILTHVWPSNASKHRKASYIRIADKFLVLPQSDTFLKWVHPEARKIMRDGYGKGVEYMQANIVGGALSICNGLTPLIYH